MRLEESSIYPFIKQYPELQKLYRVPGGKVVVSLFGGEDEYVWFLINGKVKVEAEGENGKRMMVDILVEDNYVGHLSNFFGQNFYCTSTAVVTSTFIRIPSERFKEMLSKDIRFQRHFNKKIIVRLYTMYKKDLAIHLFGQREQIAHYIITNEVGGACHVNNVNTICEMLRISRRNFYNLVKKLADDGIIEHLGGVIYIIDYDRLELEAQPVMDFFGNSV